ncbi:MAG: hypothetical protein A2499_12415 [Stygiobacter sp. RIFOXYC12_FULL_38_8]|nr:MAG: hypothetical protein A2299_09110 [Stygiobacter sp. RIFOXYB2_FULL_37_11]OGV09842.1 MAG: hypothetical protein A2237_03150 [Stygiobacter sp. RIFOXYA2_FULL_38_8]OGV15716.1 MAG: hypothetical protein A2440_01540 [Stygiobacter sp. RIFOXYC2_FULL_38_25]OGV28167.1 MAG: hypothetical protein A2499_12415 [Stygiobacter sp. RIFOXYC12_FULL_38_8]OGV80830.1 MAG: hypothetical protein A2X65_06590 [Stygiobacter sp. GWF2_38_21]RJQ63587.1 MAG: hypothetical protein C4517_04200 [Stygiobacter sp.]
MPDFLLYTGMKKYTVYVIKSSEGFQYTGMTEDLENFMGGHNDNIYCNGQSSANKFPIREFFPLRS